MLVGIVGLGYVGLTLSVIMAERGVRVLAAEINPEILDTVAKGQAHFYEAGLDRRLQRVLRLSMFSPRPCLPAEDYDAIIITVGTPLQNGTTSPNFEHIRHAVMQIREVMQPETLLILRSTVTIGTTHSLVYPLLKERFVAPRLCFAPERTVEGKALEELPVLPQAIGAVDRQSLDKAVAVFRHVTPMIIELPNPEEAEFVKLIDNVYRDVRFAFSNQMALLAERLGLDGDRIVRAANNGYPRTDLPVPGYVGGPCLSKDSHILAHSFLDQEDCSPTLALEARRVNRLLPIQVLSSCIGELEAVQKDIRSAKIFVTGFAFKGQPETDDLRDSSTLILLQELKRLGATAVTGHDFVASPEKILRAGVEPATIEEGFRDADLVIVMNNHPDYRALDIDALLKTTKPGVVLYDSWRVFDRNSINECGHVRYAALGVTFDASARGSKGAAA